MGVLTIGSIHGTLMEAMAEYPSAEPARLIKLRCFRPFPAAAIRAACAGLERLVVVERALSPGSGGIVGNEVRAALSTMDQPPRVENYAVGLGGRDVPLDLYPRLLEADGEVGGFSVFDVDVSRLAPEDQ